VVFDFRVSPPAETFPAAPARAREVAVAAFLSNARLATLRTITVQGANSARTAGR
jgi:hypothetical protein